MNLLDNLAIPIPYLMQKNIDFSCLDTFGWSLMHYAIGFNNVNKINELLLCDIHFNVNSSTNKIPTSCIVTKGKDDVDLYKSIEFIKIPFCDNGYSPIHLNVFLNRYYKNRFHQDYRPYEITQEIIFKRFLEKFPDCMFWQDSNMLTVTDYCILSHNFSFLKTIKNYDSSLNSLSAVNPLTASKIIELEISRNQPNRDNNISGEEFNFMKDMVDFFKSKDIKDKLQDKLVKKSDKIEKVKI